MNLSVRGLKSEMRYRHFQVRYSRTLKRIWNWTHTPPESLRWSDIEDFFKAWEREYFFGPCKFHGTVGDHTHIYLTTKATNGKQIHRCVWPPKEDRPLDPGTVGKIREILREVEVEPKTVRSLLDNERGA